MRMVDFTGVLQLGPTRKSAAYVTILLFSTERVRLKPIAKGTLETARIEAGLVRLGPDINERIVSPEANLEGTAFSLSKGCYPAQEVVVPGWTPTDQSNGGW